MNLSIVKKKLSLLKPGDEVKIKRNDEYTQTYSFLSSSQQYYERKGKRTIYTFEEICGGYARFMVIRDDDLDALRRMMNFTFPLKTNPLYELINN